MFKGDERTALVRKNILGSFLVKGWSSVVQFLLVPVTLLCLDQYEYGIWLTVNSILLWIDQFDIGLGNGLRNKLAESLARGDRERARAQVSTTLGMLILIVIPLFLLCAAVVSGTDCYRLLNVNPAVVPGLSGILLISLALVGATFVFKFIGNVYLALQLPAVNSLIIAAGQTVALGGIALLSLLGDRSLLHVALVYTASPLAVYLLSWPLTFTRYRYLRPSLRLFNCRELRGLFTLGMRFFLVQLAGLVIFASSNVLISHLFTPAEVTPYQVAFRYFSLAVMLFAIISAPLWSATTDAYTKNDWPWIERTMRTMRRVMAAFALLLVVMAAVAQVVYALWVGRSVAVPPVLSVLMAVYVAVLIYSTCYSNILFGIGKLRMITAVTLLEAVVYIPLAVLFGRRFGLCGIVAALILVNILCAVSNRIQYHKLAKGTARGVWNK